MKYIIVLMLICLKSICLSQIDPLGASIIKINNKYILSDTVLTGTDTLIRRRTFDSIELAQNLFTYVYNSTRDAVDQIITIEKHMREINKYRKLIDEVEFADDYMQYSLTFIEFHGNWNVYYNKTSTILKVGDDGNLYTMQNNKVINSLPITNNFRIANLLTFENETIQIYKVNDSFWWGKGKYGDFIMRREKR